MDDVVNSIVDWRLDVGQGHTLYIEQSGNPEGIPVLFLHGGPGGSCQASHRTLFDLNRFHVIAMDQRGSGRSTPHASLNNNTTWDLVADIELLREKLAIEKWMLVGGSWGSTLSLAYAQLHPNRVAAIALRSLFLGTEIELQQAFIDLPRFFYPELLTSFIAYLPEDERHKPLNAYYQRLLDPDPDVHLPAMYIWHDYERSLSKLIPDSSFSETISQINSGQTKSMQRPKPNSPLMEAHYFSNDCFFKPMQLLNNMRVLAEIPGGIVQSRFDLLCPPGTSFAVTSRWPNAKLSLVEAAGHAQNEVGVSEALSSLVHELADRIEISA